MSAKFPNAKRFSIESVESQVPALKAIIEASAENGMREIIFPFCHRGKLNELSNAVQKSNELIFISVEIMALTELLMDSIPHPCQSAVRWLRLVRNHASEKIEARELIL